MKAVNKFKKLVAQNRPAVMSSILGEEDSSRFSQPPLSMSRGPKAPPLPHKSQSVTTFDRRAVEGALVVEGVHLKMDAAQLPDLDNLTPHEDHTVKATTSSLEAKQSARPAAISSPPKYSADQTPDQGSGAEVSRKSTGTEDEEQFLAFRPEHSPSDPDRARSYDEIGHRGQAHDPLQDQLYLHIGPSTFSGVSSDADRRASFALGGEMDDYLMVSESPGAADIDIYETAYRDEIERIRQRCRDEGKDEEESTVYLTRRVDARLLAVGQLAGRFMAKGEEGLDRFGTATGWKDKKARVTDVSRALRAAAREEYEKRRQERLQRDRAPPGPAESANVPPKANTSAEDRPDSSLRQSGGPQSPASSATQSRNSSMFGQAILAGRAMEKGRQAKTSFKSFMGFMKEKSNASKDDNQAP